MCSVTMVTLVTCTPLALVAIQPVTSVAWRRPNVVALGHLLYQVTLLASYPRRCITPTIGSLVTPSFCLGTSHLCLPVPCA